MRTLNLALARTPVLGRCLLTVLRAKVGWAYLRPAQCNLLKWLFTSRELTNFTCDLEDDTRHYLAALIADVSGQPYQVVLGYFRELEGDVELRAHLESATRTSELAFMADSQVRYGRRIGWYALVRALKPKVVIETGIDKGLGSCVLSAALRRNSREGAAGRYYGTDINPKAGYLLSGEYAKYGQVLYGDSIESLRAFEGNIDLFINDSDHSAEYEAREYEVIASKLSPRAVVLGDNSHVTDKLLQFSLATGRQFAFFKEQPKDHWYPGGGIGISFKR